MENPSQQGQNEISILNNDTRFESVLPIIINFLQNIWWEFIAQSSFQ